MGVIRGKIVNFCKEESFHEPTIVEVIRIEDVDISYHRSVDIQDKERVNSITDALSRLGRPVFVQNCFCIINWERPVGSLVQPECRCLVLVNRKTLNNISAVI